MDDSGSIRAGDIVSDSTYGTYLVVTGLSYSMDGMPMADAFPRVRNIGSRFPCTLRVPLGRLTPHIRPDELPAVGMEGIRRNDVVLVDGGGVRYVGDVADGTAKLLPFDCGDDDGAQCYECVRDGSFRVLSRTERIEYPL